ncbi:sigma-70 family RNA polymerase sigma factor [Paenibacillus pinihumi]|uniref:sigma-70 family RNA polymerase sigma factor n=1 Tax=Paenibacillus pinihumi TaxID=669462 RepID=UPI000688A5D4|nr:sigma-70 family RNA polymerase sigma factor [Paenibacillus pinihumi]
MEYTVDEKGFLTDLRQLKKAYRETLKGLQAYRKQLEQKVEAAAAMSMEELKEKPNRPRYKDLQVEHAEIFDEIDVIKGMISDVNYAIEWLHTGRQPGTRRGIDRRAVYQNTILMDPSIMANFSNQYNSRSSTTLTEHERDRLRDVLQILSEQERKCYVLSYGHGYSHSEIARMLVLQKGTVDKYVQRAHEKVSKGWQGTMF